MQKLDRYDLEILRYLQEDGRLSNIELAEKVALTPAPCLRRVRRLEEEGYIRRYTGIVNREAMGLDVMAFVHVSLISHNKDTLVAFDKFVATNECVMECYSISGEHDFMLKVLAGGIDEVEHFLLQSLMSLDIVRNANTTFVLSERKYATSIPIDSKPRHVKHS